MLLLLVEYLEQNYYLLSFLLVMLLLLFEYLEQNNYLFFYSRRKEVKKSAV